MHIADGVLSLEVTVVVSAVSLFAFYKAIKAIKEDEIPLTAVASAMFFIASFIHIPFGVTQIHLILLGVIGIFLGLSSFIAILIALILQALLLGYGGVASIGVNLFVMATPAVIIYHINKTEIFLRINEKVRFFLIGFLGAFFATLFLVLILYFSKPQYEWAAYSIFGVNIITMIIEGFVSMFLLMFIKKTCPKLLSVKKQKD